MSPALAAAAAVTAAVALLGRALCGRAGAALAPALLWLSPRVVDAVRAWPAASAVHPLRVLLLTVPAGALAALAGGALHTAWLALRAARRGDPSLRREVALLAAAALPLAAAAWRGGGPGLAYAALPLLAPMGARALVTAGRTLWPARAGRVVAALALLALAPGARALWHAWPLGSAAWNELAGGAPGAAAAGLPRQADGEAAASLLEAIGAHAVPGARIWWHRTRRDRVEAWQREGRLRGDLAWAEGPEDADLALWQAREDEQDREYRIWTAFRSARPVDGVFLDEVPLALLYARAGAWR